LSTNPIELTDRFSETEEFDEKTGRERDGEGLKDRDKERGGGGGGGKKKKNLQKDISGNGLRKEVGGLGVVVGGGGSAFETAYLQVKGVQVDI